MSAVKRRIFPESFKREALDRVTTSGLSAGAAAKELDLHETVLRRWITQFGMQATGKARCPHTQAPAPSDVAAEVARLRRDNDRLRMDKPWSSSDRPPDDVRVVDEHRQVWPVRMMCAVLGLSASGYYAWRTRRRFRRSWPTKRCWATST